MTTPSGLQSANPSCGESIEGRVATTIDALINSLPDPHQLSADQRRGIIARYTAVLEGNFIYWMTGTYLAVKSAEGRSIIIENLRDEVRDCHPGMLRRFALAAHAAPTESDALAVYRDLTHVRLFVGRLAGVPLVLMMAFFEGFIQRFMKFLAELAAGQGSVEKEYTDVHGVCDVGHTQELFQALNAEMTIDPPKPGTNLFEGVELLSSLIQTIVQEVKSQNGLHLQARLAAH